MRETIGITTGPGRELPIEQCKARIIMRSNPSLRTITSPSQRNFSLSKWKVPTSSHPFRSIPSLGDTGYLLQQIGIPLGLSLNNLGATGGSPNLIGTKTVARHSGLYCDKFTVYSKGVVKVSASLAYCPFLIDKGILLKRLQTCK